jgi:hypothetical protein
MSCVCQFFVKRSLIFSGYSWFPPQMIYLSITEIMLKVALNTTNPQSLTGYKNKNCYCPIEGPQGAKSLHWFINNNIKKIKNINMKTIATHTTWETIIHYSLLSNLYLTKVTNGWSYPIPVYVVINNKSVFNNEIICVYK